VDALKEALQLVAQIERRRLTNRLDYYQPYKFQRDFHNAKGFQTGLPASQKVLMAGNGVGKTLCGANDTAIHLTGRYPDWWEGQRSSGPVEVVAAGKTNDTVKMVVQKELFGDPLDDTKLGTGAIPLDHLVKSKITRKPGVPNAIQDALVRHVSGGYSKLNLMAYEQKPRAFMGIRFDFGWLDEEPPADIWSQFIRGTISRRNAILSITFTPEEGLTDVVNQFMNDIRPGQALIRASWDDVSQESGGHITKEEMDQREQALQPHEREMRKRGIPQYGAGLVFPFGDELEVESFAIPKHWPRVIGIDFGWDHPFAACMLAWDRDADCVYVMADYRESRTTPAIHAAAVKPWGKWPVAWPHDGLNAEKRTGEQLKKAYEDEGLELLGSHATNPPQVGQKEGEGGNSVEASILAMYERMETGRWKVFKTCRNWLEEQRIYHRDKDARLMKLRDDVISASRYAHMMLRHARVETLVLPKRQMAMGARNW
jgi:phage terminase large subunit-like protein